MILVISLLKIFNINDYLCIIHDLSKAEATNLLQISVLGNCGYIQKILSDFFLEVINLKNAKHLKRLREELMPLVR